MNEMPREMLIDVIHQLIASLNHLRALVLAITPVSSPQRGEKGTAKP
jgi:hypothetical protein